MRQNINELVDGSAAALTADLEEAFDMFEWGGDGGIREDVQKVLREHIKIGVLNVLDVITEAIQKAKYD